MSINVTITPTTSPTSYHSTTTPALTLTPSSAVTSSSLSPYTAPPNYSPSRSSSPELNDAASHDVLALFNSIEEGTWISQDPRLFDTHFIQLTKRKIKGQAKYRCRMCQHEFTCCGKRRRLQHILGDDLLLGKTKNVINCRTPYLPLKHALIQAYEKKAKEDAERREAKAKAAAEDREGRNTSSDEGNHNSKSRPKDRPEEFEDLIQNLDFHSTDDADDGHESSMSEGVHEAIHTSNSVSLSTSPSGDDLQFIPKRLKQEGMTSLRSGSSDIYNPKLARSTDSAMSLSSEPGISLTSSIPFSAELVADYNNRVQLNRAILNFFFIYRIPLTAVENQDFHEFMNAVQSLQGQQQQQNIQNTQLKPE